MNVCGITPSEWLQYGVIAALFVAAIADRAAHRAYARELSKAHADMALMLARIEAKLDGNGETS